MNRISAFDSCTVSLETSQALSAWAGRLLADARGLRRAAARRIAALEPELTLTAVIAPLVIAVVAALPIFVAA